MEHCQYCGQPIASIRRTLYLHLRGTVSCMDGNPSHVASPCPLPPAYATAVMDAQGNVTLMIGGNA